MTSRCLVSCKHLIWGVVACIGLCPMAATGQDLVHAQAWEAPEPASAFQQRPQVATAGFENLPAGSSFQIDPGLDHFRHGGRISMMFPDEQIVAMDFEPVTIHANGDVTTHGHMPDESRSGYAFLTIGQSGLFGRIATESGQFLVHTDAGGTWLVALDHPYVHVHQDCPVTGRTHDFLKPTVTDTDQSGSGTIQIDQMIIYTSGVQERYPGDLIDTRVNHLVALTNQAMTDSNLDIVLRLVHHELTNNFSDDSNFDALDDMRLALAGEPVAGLEDLAATREAFGADLIALLSTANIETRGACGVAYFPFFNENLGEYDNSYAVQISNDGVTNWSVCADSTFPHEVGHQLGAHHHRESFNPDFLPDTTGFGLVVPDRYNTLMSSISSADVNRYKRLNVFTNPDIQCGGDPCGSNEPGKEINNAEVMAVFAPIVADYMNATIPGEIQPPPPSMPDSDGDGIPDWDDPYPFDPYNGKGPEPDPPRPWPGLPMHDGSQLDHYELLVASSGSDEIHAWLMDGEHAGLVVKAQPDDFPDERPAFSEYTRFVVAGDGLIYALSHGEVRRYDRIHQDQLDIHLSSQPPYSLVPGELYSGFPKALAFNDDESLLTISLLATIDTYDPDRLRIGFTFPFLPDGSFLSSHGVRDLVYESGLDSFVVIEAITRRILRFAQFNDNEPEVLSGPDPAFEDPWGLTIGPDDFLYVANGSAGNVLRVDPDSGDISTFIESGSGGLSFARDLVFGPDEKLYVLDRDQAAVLRFDAQTQELIDHFVGPNANQLDDAQSMLINVRPNLEIFQDRFESH